MRYVSLVVLFVSSVMLGVRSVDAAHGPRFAPHSVGVHTPVARHGMAGHRATSHPTWQMPRIRVSAPTGQAASALHIPESSFSPATVDTSTNGEGTVDNATADGKDSQGNYNLVMRDVHTKNYADMGRVNGYYEQGNWQPSGSSDSVFFSYMGSIFSSTAGAQTAYADGVSGAKAFSGAQSADCSSAINMACTAVVFSGQNTAGNSYTWTFTFLQYNQCLAEAEADASSTLYNANSSQIDQTLANIAGAAAGALQSACAPGGGTTATATATATPRPTATPTATQTSTTTSWKLLAVRIERYGAKPDYDLVKPPMTQTKAGTKLQINVYWRVDSGYASEPFTIHLSITSGGRSVIAQDFNNKLDATQPVDTYHDALGPWKPKKGKYSVTARLTLGNRAQQGSTALSVTPKKQPAPPPPPPATFSFDKLLITDAGNHAKTAFAVREDVRITAVYSVRNLRAGQILTGQVARTIQIATNGQFKSVVHNSDDIVVNGNGTFSKQHDTGGFTIPGTFRILVGVTLGNKTVTKQAQITVR